jgi:hypothetical protein
MARGGERSASTFDDANRWRFWVMIAGPRNVGYQDAVSPPE